jgi:hypothetical protein
VAANIYNRCSILLLSEPFHLHSKSAHLLYRCINVEHIYSRVRIYAISAFLFVVLPTPVPQILAGTTANSVTVAALDPQALVTE